jgi:hypothetical protein
MRGSFLALAVLALLPISTALGQYSAVIVECRWDSQRLCGGVVPQGGGLARCIEEKFGALGESCRAALVRIAAVRQACDADIAQQCPGTKPGRGRILLCVKARYAALSDPCKHALGHAAERNAPPR